MVGGRPTNADRDSAASVPDSETPAPVGVRSPPHLLWAAGIGALAVALLLLVGLAVDRWPFGFDRAIIVGLRVPGHLATPIGPAWLAKAMVDITALGGGTVLTIVVLATIGLLLMQRAWVTAALVLAATWSGSLAVQLLKVHVDRARPLLVPHLVDAGGMSFPSGHSANSAIVYLTMVGLVSQIVRGRAVRNYLVVLTVLLVGAIGCSRVYLGVHWPSDVLAGWSFGTLWALGWWWAGARARASVAGARE